MAYVVVKNNMTVIPHSLNKYTWKYLDECQEFAAQQCKPGDVIEICELTPKFVYKLELNEEEVPGHTCPSSAPAEQLPDEGAGSSSDEPPAQEEDNAGNVEPDEPAEPGNDEENKPGLPITDLGGEEEE